MSSKQDNVNDTKTMKPRDIALMIVAGIVSLAAAIIALPTIGNFIRGPVRIDENEREIRELKVTVKDQGFQVMSIESRLEKLETTVVEGNRRTEETLRNMTERFADVAASARAMERSVSSVIEIVHNAKANANNALVRSDKALDTLEDAGLKPKP